MEIYLVVDCGYNPGRIYACFEVESDADTFAIELEEVEGSPTQVVPRTLYTALPPILGYNK